MEFVNGTSEWPAGTTAEHVPILARALAKLHGLTIAAGLCDLETRDDPCGDLPTYLPAMRGGDDLGARLEQIKVAATPTVLLHGDYWPGNVLWNERGIAAIIGWEDAAIGDPASDVACARLELSYQHGEKAMEQFVVAYRSAASHSLDNLALWQLYVCAAASSTMSAWGLPTDTEAHMRACAQRLFDQSRATLGV